MDRFLSNAHSIVHIAGIENGGMRATWVGGGAFVEQARIIGRYGWLWKRRQVGKKFVDCIVRTSLGKIVIPFFYLILLGHPLLSRAHQSLYALVSTIALSLSNKFSHNYHLKSTNN